MDPSITAFETGLLAALNRFLVGVRALSGLRALSGGASQETWSFDAVCDSGTERLVLRKESPGAGERSRANAGLENEAALMQLAAGQGIPAPAVRYVLRPEDGIGVGFIMDRIEGETIARKILRDPQFDAVRPALARRCGEYLARIHRIDRGSLPPLRVESASAAVEHYFNDYRRLNHPRPVFELAFRWVREHTPATLEVPRLVHGDFRNGNLIIGPDGVRAVLDWELAHLGDPMEDLGWICVNSWRFGNIDMPVGGFGRREDLFAGYEAAGGGAVDPDRVKFWETFGTLKWGVMCENMVASFLSGTDRSVETAAIGRRVSETEIDLLCLLAPRKAGELM